LQAETKKEEALALVRQRERERRRYQYIADINLAYQALLDKDLDRVRSLLKRYEPESGAEDLRGFEWYYLVDKVRHGSPRPKRDEAGTARGPSAGQPRLAVVPGDRPTLAVAQLGAATVRLIDLRNGESAGALPTQPKVVKGLTAAGEFLAVATEDGAVKLWNVATKRVDATLCESGSGITSLAASGDGRTVAATRLDGTVGVWDSSTRKPVPGSPPKGSPTHSLALSHDGKLLPYTRPKARAVFLWDVGGTADPVRIPTGQLGVMVLAPDGRTLATAAQEGVTLWDVATRTKRTALAEHAGNVTRVVFAPDGPTLASASLDSRVKLWDVTTREGRASLVGHAGYVYSVAFSPDGETLASGGSDKTVKLWDAAMGKERATLKGHTQGVRCVAFSPDSKTLASASEDKTVKLWNVATGKERTTLRGHTNFVYAVVFSPDGKTLACGARGHTVKFWEVSALMEH
jgi:WD40 repeat protein